jgi:hypothetical protein
MTDRSPAGMRPDVIYGRSAHQVLAAARALRVLPGPQDPSQARTLHLAAGRAGRTVVEVDRGRVVLGWDTDAEGVWAAEGMEAVRSARPAQPRLLRTLAACLRCCWVDPDAPIYPARSASIEDVLAAASTLGGINEADESGPAGMRHTRGALTTLDAAGLITLDGAERTVALGPVIATWPEQDVSVLRATWARLPAPPTRIRQGVPRQSRDA